MRRHTFDIIYASTIQVRTRAFSVLSEFDARHFSTKALLAPRQSSDCWDLEQRFIASTSEPSEGSRAAVLQWRRKRQTYENFTGVLVPFHAGARDSPCTMLRGNLGGEGGSVRRDEATADASCPRVRVFYSCLDTRI